MLSQTVEYALRAVVFLASESPAACTTEQIAAKTRVPRAYLSKVLQSLVRGNVLRSRRGVGGGISLAKSTETTTILDVVNAVEPLCRIYTCPLGIAAHGARLCALHKRLDAAIAGVERAFVSTTLAEVIAEPSKSKPLCDVPSPSPAPRTRNKRK
jgi:Rrf2 family protein